MKPSQIYFRAKGPGICSPDIASAKLDVLSREVERQMLQAIAEDAAAQGRNIRPADLWNATRDEDLLQRLQGHERFPSLPPEQLQLTLCAIRDRAEALAAADIKSNQLLRRRLLIAATLAILLLPSVFVLNFKQPTIDAFNKLKAQKATLPYAGDDVRQADQAVPIPSPGLHMYGAPAAPNKIDAWLSFSCPNCILVWDNLKNNLGEVLGDGDTAVEVHVVVPKDKRTLTLAFYYEAILNQDVELAKEFVTWVYDNQGKIKANGLQGDELLWIKDRLDFEQFTADIQSQALQKRLAAKAAWAKSLNLAGTPTLFVNGSPLLGAEITPENITRLLGQSEDAPASTNG